MASSSRKFRLPVRWLHVGAMAAGMGAALTTGQGLALADDTASSSSSAPDTSSSSSSAGGVSRPGSSGPAASSEADSGTDAGTDTATSTNAAKTGAADTGVKDNTGVRSDSDAEMDDTQPVLTDTATADAVQPVEAAADTDHDSAALAARDSDTAEGSDAEHTAPTIASPASATTGQAFPDTTDDTDDSAVTAATGPTPAAPASTPTPTPTSTVADTAPSYPPAVSAPVTWQSMVADVLTWSGLGAPSSQLPIPATPVPDLIAALWVAVRRVHYSLFNSSPTMAPTQLERDPVTGVITGTLGGFDADGDLLTYTVTSAPQHGGVSIDATGIYTYTPDLDVAATVGIDSFAVTVSDATGNPWHIHGLADILTHLGHTTEATTITVAAFSPNTVIATIGVGTTPYGVAISPDGATAYVANSGSGTVSVIDTVTNTVIATIDVGTYPDGVAVSPNRSRLYVTNSGSNTVSVIDTSTNTVTTTIDVGNSPRGVAISPNGNRVFVTNYRSNTVSVVDTTRNTVIATIRVGINPEGVAVDPDGTAVYVANQGSGTVSVISTGGFIHVTNTIGVGIYRPQRAVVSPDGSRLYVTNYFSGDVLVIDTRTNKVTTSIHVGGNPQTVSVSPDGSRLYVASTGSTLSVIDAAANAVIAHIGADAYGVAVSPDGTRVYVTNPNSNTVSVIWTALSAAVHMPPA